MRIGVLGLGIIGKRLADAIGETHDLSLSGVVTRSAGPGVLARPGLETFAFDRAARNTLLAAGLTTAGLLEDLLERVDLLIDAGPSRTGISRRHIYESYAVKAIFCGGERDESLGPVVHSALNYEAAIGKNSLRMTSCNTTAVGRVVAAIGPEHIDHLTATVIRCATDTDKASKGIVNGAIFDAEPSHHARDLAEIVPALSARSWAVTVPMTSGHLIGLQVDLGPDMSCAMAISKLAETPRLSVLPPGSNSTTQLKASTARLRGGRGDRYDLAVQAQPDGPRRLFAWLSLDNEAITIPECLDLVRAAAGHADADSARRLTDATLNRPSQTLRLQEGS